METTTQILIDRLKSGEKIVCQKCKEGFIVPVNASDKDADISELHLFKCTNCDYYIERIPSITIE